MKTSYKVSRMPFYLASRYIIANHYSRTMPPTMAAYGLFEEGYDNLIGACVFGTGMSPEIRQKPLGKEYEELVFELVRVHILDVTPKNTESWFISRAMKMFKVDHPQALVIFSFSDPVYNHNGTIYKALNFIHTGKGGRSNMMVDRCGNRIHPRSNQNRKYTTAELKQQGLESIQIPQKDRWMYVIANNRKQKRIITRHIQQAVLTGQWPALSQEIIELGKKAEEIDVRQQEIF